MNTSAVIKMTELGLSIANTVVLYFDYKIAPRPQDPVFIVGYDKNGIPRTLKELYNSFSRTCTWRFWKT